MRHRLTFNVPKTTMTTALPELISAYLDGEVTAEERAAVEQALVEDATLRRLFYELRALRKQLGRLPRYRVKADLSREVLRRAERLLLQPDIELDEEAQKIEHQLAKPRRVALSGAIQRPIRWWQVAAWCGASIAASVTLLLLQPGNDAGPGQLAQAPKRADKSQPIVPEANRTQRQLEAPSEQPIAKPADQELTPRPAVAPASDRPPLDAVAQDATDLAHGAADGKPTNGTGDELPRSKQMAKGARDHAESLPGGGMGGGGVGGQGQEFKSATGALPPPAKLAQQPSSDEDNKREIEDREKANALGPAVAGGAAPSLGFDGAGGAGPRLETGQLDKAKVGGFAQRQAREAVEQDHLASTDGTVMIHCNVQGRDFEPLLRDSLARHNIAWNDAQANASAGFSRALKGNAPANFARKGTSPAKALPAPPSAATFDDDRHPAEFADFGEALDATQAQAELVYVVATREQIEGVLAELRDKPAVFLTANVHPVPGAKAQAELTRWNWSALPDAAARGEPDAGKLAAGEERKLDAKKIDEKTTDKRRADDSAANQSAANQPAGDKFKEQSRDAADKSMGEKSPAEKTTRDSAGDAKDGGNKNQADRSGRGKSAAEPPLADKDRPKSRLDQNDAADLATKRMFAEDSPAKSPPSPPGAATRMRLSDERESQTTQRMVAPLKPAAPQSSPAPQAAASPAADNEKGEGDRTAEAATKRPSPAEPQAPSAPPAVKRALEQSASGPAPATGTAAAEDSMPKPLTPPHNAPGQTSPADDSPAKADAGESQVEERVQQQPLRVLFVFRVQPDASLTSPPAAAAKKEKK